MECLPLITGCHRSACERFDVHAPLSIMLTPLPPVPHRALARAPPLEPLTKDEASCVTRAMGRLFDSNEVLLQELLQAHRMEELFDVWSTCIEPPCFRGRSWAMISQYGGTLLLSGRSQLGRYPLPSMSKTLIQVKRTACPCMARCSFSSGPTGTLPRWPGSTGLGLISPGLRR